MSDSAPHEWPLLQEIALKAIAPVVQIWQLTKADLPEAISQAAADPDLADRFMRLHYLFLALGNEAGARQMQAKALSYRRTFRVIDPSPGPGCWPSWGRAIC
jgi:hypothetical protein